MDAEVPAWMGGIIVVLLIFFLLPTNRDENPGNYNRGVLQQTSPQKLKRYVAKTWDSKGYNTEISHNDREYIDVLAESQEEVVAISVRRRQENDSVSRNAVKRFAHSSQEFGVDRAVMVSTSYFTKPARDAAEQSNILLLDGEELADLFTKHDGIPP